MKIRRQIQIALAAALVVAVWAVVKLVVPWVQRTVSDPELRPPENAEVRLLDESIGLGAPGILVGARWGAGS